MEPTRGITANAITRNLTVKALPADISLPPAEAFKQEVVDSPLTAFLAECGVEPRATAMAIAKN